MAFSGLLALLDDVAAIADDVATMTLEASQKTSALVTDDMAVTAEQALGIPRDRELPVVWKVFLGSMFNKAVILVPAALLLNWLAPWLLTPILMAGGTFLCFEGVEKIAHWFAHPTDHEKTHGKANKPVDLEAFENERVSGAIRTDLILSAEIVAISLGVVQSAEFAIQIGALYAIAVLMTVGVYGAVALLVRLDDIGEGLVTAGGPQQAIGRAILMGTPYLLKAISWIGTVAMLLVGGHILLHGIPPLEHAVHDLLHGLHLPGWLEGLASTGVDFVLGGLVGAVVVGIVAVWPFGGDDEPSGDEHGHADAA